MDIEKAFKSIQNSLIVTRERDHCMTQVCPCCGNISLVLILAMLWVIA